MSQLARAVIAGLTLEVNQKMQAQGYFLGLDPDSQCRSAAAIRLTSPKLIDFAVARLFDNAIANGLLGKQRAINLKVTYQFLARHVYGPRATDRILLSEVRKKIANSSQATLVRCRAAVSRHIDALCRIGVAKVKGKYLVLLHLPVDAWAAFREYQRERQRLRAARHRQKVSAQSGRQNVTIGYQALLEKAVKAATYVGVTASVFKGPCRTTKTAQPLAGLAATGGASFVRKHTPQEKTPTQPADEWGFNRLRQLALAMNQKLQKQSAAPPPPGRLRGGTLSPRESLGAGSAKKSKTSFTAAGKKEALVRLRYFMEEHSALWENRPAPVNLLALANLGGSDDQVRRAFSTTAESLRDGRVRDRKNPGAHLYGTLRNIITWDAWQKRGPKPSDIPF